MNSGLQEWREPWSRPNACNFFQLCTLKERSSLENIFALVMDSELGSVACVALTSPHFMRLYFCTVNKLRASQESYHLFISVHKRLNVKP